MFENKKVQEQYDLALKSVDKTDSEHNKHLTVDEVLTAHFLIAEFFLGLGEGLGGVGVRDFNLLHSALHRQNFYFNGVCKYVGVFEIGAALMYGLIKNHPFHDANKRTAFLSTLFYLQKHNYIPSVSEKEFEDFLVEIADGKIQQKSRFKQLKKTSSAPEVDYIAWYLKQNTREIDKRQYLITYRQLARILRGFNCDLKNPSHGKISVYQYRKKILVNPFSSKPSSQTEIKIGTIAFPGESKQVGKSIVKQVREMTGLTPQKGYDSQVFYKEVDPLAVLINKYEAPLRRLANR